MSGGGDAQAKARAETNPVNHFVCWFNTNSANLNTEVKKKTLFASVEAATSGIESEWCDEKKSDVEGAAPAQSDVRQVIYSAEDVVIGFPSQNCVAGNAESRVKNSVQE